jgi:hypothetical protein
VGKECLGMYNLAEVKRKLFDYFTKNDVIHIEKHFKDVFILSEDADLEKALIEEALKEFQDKDLVIRVKGHGVDAWVLKRPLSEYSQTIELNFNVINAIAQTINGFCDELNIQDGKIDPLNIRERDIENLVLIIHNLTTKGTVEG